MSELAPGAIDYKGKGATVSVTAGAREIMEGYGYRFSLQNGSLIWDLRGEKPVNVDVAEEDAHSSLALTFKDIDTPAGRFVFLCQVYTMRRDGSRKHNHYYLETQATVDPLRGIDPGHQSVREHCPHSGR